MLTNIFIPTNAHTLSFFLPPSYWLMLSKNQITKGTFKIHLSARICFSALSENRRVTL